jgi:hypothetical protein
MSDGMTGPEGGGAARGTSCIGDRTFGLEGVEALGLRAPGERFHGCCGVAGNPPGPLRAGVAPFIVPRGGGLRYLT